MIDYLTQSLEVPMPILVLGTTVYPRWNDIQSVSVSLIYSCWDYIRLLSHASILSEPGYHSTTVLVQRLYGHMPVTLILALAHTRSVQALSQ